MAKSNPNLTDIFTDVANSIRAKKGTSEEIYPVDFADEIATITGGGDQPQLHAVTGLNQSVGIVTWTGDSYTEAYKLYLDSSLVDTVTTSVYDLTTLTVTTGSHTFGVAATATNFIDSTSSTLTFAKQSITVNIINGTVSGPSTMYSWDSAQLTITPDAGLDVIINSVVNAIYDFNNVTNIITLSHPTDNVIVNIECKTSTTRIIGFTGMSQSDPTLTRTDDAIGATWAAADGVIEVSGIDMTKIWGGYIGNDGEALTWDSTNNKYLLNGEEYTGNVFSKLNRFFVKPSYVEIDNAQVLDGFKLAFTQTAPDDTWQDWFNGKAYVAIGCYRDKTARSDTPVPLVSKQGTYAPNSGSRTGIDVIDAYKLNSTLSGNLHVLWYNELAILQVLFMAIFATRKTETVFPNWRVRGDTKPTGCLDNMRALSTIATGYDIRYADYRNANIFLGIEDFTGFGYDIVGGVIISYNGNAIMTSIDYANFNPTASYPSADINFANITSQQEIKSLQLSSTVPGLILPSSSIENSSYDTYFCDRIFLPTSSSAKCCIYVGIDNADSYSGIFSNYDSEGYGSLLRDNRLAARLCRTPA